MPAFRTVLSRKDLAAVAVYVAALNGIAESQTSAAPISLSPDAIRGRELFSEATRGFGRCSTCHEVGSIGIPVATPMKKVPENVAALRAMRTPHVLTVFVDGQAIPALLVSLGKRRIILYDLTSSPPVQLSLEPDAVKVTGTGNWYHAAAMSSYDDAELASILSYLSAVTK